MPDKGEMKSANLGKKDFELEESDGDNSRSPRRQEKENVDSVQEDPHGVEEDGRRRERHRR